MNYEVIPTAYFERQAKKLKKKYPNINRDLIELIDKLESGKLEGDPIQGFHNHVFKARVKSKDLQRGKSGSYRIIYFVKFSNGRIYLLTVYVKAKIEDLSRKEIEEIIKGSSLF